MPNKFQDSDIHLIPIDFLMDSFCYKPFDPRHIKKEISKCKNNFELEQKLIKIFHFDSFNFWNLFSLAGKIDSSESSYTSKNYSLVPEYIFRGFIALSSQIQSFVLMTLNNQEIDSFPYQCWENIHYLFDIFPELVHIFPDDFFSILSLYLNAFQDASSLFSSNILKQCLTSFSCQIVQYLFRDNQISQFFTTILPQIPIDISNISFLDYIILTIYANFQEKISKESNAINSNICLHNHEQILFICEYIIEYTYKLDAEEHVFNLGINSLKFLSVFSTDNSQLSYVPIIVKFIKWVLDHYIQDGTQGMDALYSILSNEVIPDINYFYWKDYCSLFPILPDKITIQDLQLENHYKITLKLLTNFFLTHHNSELIRALITYVTSFKDPNLFSLVLFSLLTIPISNYSIFFSACSFFTNSFPPFSLTYPTKQDHALCFAFNIFLYSQCFLQKDKSTNIYIQPVIEPLFYFISEQHSASFIHFMPLFRTLLFENDITNFVNLFSNHLLLEFSSIKDKTIYDCAIIFCEVAADCSTIDCFQGFTIPPILTTEILNPRYQNCLFPILKKGLNLPSKYSLSSVQDAVLGAISCLSAILRQIISSSKETYAYFLENILIILSEAVTYYSKPLFASFDDQKIIVSFSLLSTNLKILKNFIHFLKFYCYFNPSILPVLNSSNSIIYENIEQNYSRIKEHFNKSKIRVNDLNNENQAQSYINTNIKNENLYEKDNEHIENKQNQYQSSNSQIYNHKTLENEFEQEISSIIYELKCLIVNQKDFDPNFIREYEIQNNFALKLLLRIVFKTKWEKDVLLLLQSLVASSQSNSYACFASNVSNYALDRLSDPVLRPIAKLLFLDISNIFFSRYVFEKALQQIIKLSDGFRTSKQQTILESLLILLHSDITIPVSSYFHFNGSQSGVVAISISNTIFNNPFSVAFYFSPSLNVASNLNKSNSSPNSQNYDFSTDFDNSMPILTFFNSDNYIKIEVNQKQLIVRRSCNNYENSIVILNNLSHQKWEKVILFFNQSKVEVKTSISKRTNQNINNVSKNSPNSLIDQNLKYQSAVFELNGSPFKSDVECQYASYGNHFYHGEIGPTFLFGDCESDIVLNEFEAAISGNEVPQHSVLSFCPWKTQNSEITGVLTEKDSYYFVGNSVPVRTGFTDIINSRLYFAQFLPLFLLSNHPFISDIPKPNINSESDFTNVNNDEDKFLLFLTGILEFLLPQKEFEEKFLKIGGFQLFAGILSQIKPSQFTQNIADSLIFLLESIKGMVLKKQMAEFILLNFDLWKDKSPEFQEYLYQKTFSTALRSCHSAFIFDSYDFLLVEAQSPFHKYDTNSIVYFPDVPKPKDDPTIEIEEKNANEFENNHKAQEKIRQIQFKIINNLMDPEKSADFSILLLFALYHSDVYIKISILALIQGVIAKPTPEILDEIHKHNHFFGFLPLLFEGNRELQITVFPIIINLIRLRESSQDWFANFDLMKLMIAASLKLDYITEELAFYVYSSIFNSLDYVVFPELIPLFAKSQFLSRKFHKNINEYNNSMEKGFQLIIQFSQIGKTPTWPFWLFLLHESINIDVFSLVSTDLINSQNFSALRTLLAFFQAIEIYFKTTYLPRQKLLTLLSSHPTLYYLSVPYRFFYQLSFDPSPQKIDLHPQITIKNEENIKNDIEVDPNEINTLIKDKNLHFTNEDLNNFIEFLKNPKLIAFENDEKTEWNLSEIPQYQRETLESLNSLLFPHVLGTNSSINITDSWILYSKTVEKALFSKSIILSDKWNAELTSQWTSISKDLDSSILSSPDIIENQNIMKNNLQFYIKNEIERRENVYAHNISLSKGFIKEFLDDLHINQQITQKQHLKASNFFDYEGKIIYFKPNHHFDPHISAYKKAQGFPEEKTEEFITFKQALSLHMSFVSPNQSQPVFGNEYGNSNENSKFSLGYPFLKWTRLNINDGFRNVDYSVTFQKITSKYSGKIQVNQQEITFFGHLISIGLDTPPDPTKIRRKVLTLSLNDIVFIFTRRHLHRNISIEIYTKQNIGYLFIFQKKTFRSSFLRDVKNASKKYIIFPQVELTSNKRNSFNDIIGYIRTCLGTIVQEISSSELIIKTKLVEKWQEGLISNYTYLFILNILAGRSLNDITQYPVYPWILKDYTSESLNLDDSKIYRDFSLPIGAMNKDRLESLKHTMGLVNDPFEECLYRVHFSTAATTIGFLIRQEPFTSLHVLLQDGHFDHPDRLFFSIKSAWDCVTGPANDFRELIPQFFSNASFLRNNEKFEFGHRGNGKDVDDVILPKWSKTPEEFISIHRNALESSYVSANINEWIDLIFGIYRHSNSHNNLFHPFSYSECLNSPAIKQSQIPNIKTIIFNHTINFGTYPAKLFSSNHPSKIIKVPEFIILPPLYNVNSNLFGIQKKNTNPNVNQNFNQNNSITASTIFLDDIIFLDQGVALDKNGVLFQIMISDKQNPGKEKQAQFKEIKEKCLLPPMRSWDNAKVIYSIQTKTLVIASSGASFCIAVIANSPTPTTFGHFKTLITSIELLNNNACESKNEKTEMCITGGSDGSLCLWNLPTLELIETYQMLSGALISVSGSQYLGLIAAVDDAGNVCIQSYKFKKRLCRFQIDLELLKGNDKERRRNLISDDIKGGWSICLLDSGYLAIANDTQILLYTLYGLYLTKINVNGRVLKMRNFINIKSECYLIAGTSSHSIFILEFPNLTIIKEYHGVSGEKFSLCGVEKFLLIAKRTKVPNKLSIVSFQ